MPASDAAIVARWKPKLKLREGLLAHARRQLAYWTRQFAKSKPGTTRRAQCERMLADRQAKVIKRENQVADARAVLTRHTKPSLRERAFANAIKDLDVREQGGNNRGAQVEKIIRANGGTPGEPWCGDAVAYWYLNAGAKTVVRSWAAVRLLEQLLTRVRNPARGHVVIYNFDGGVPDHTGLFEKWQDRAAGTFWAIEGNTNKASRASDSGGGEGVHRRLRNVADVDSFRRVTR